MRLISIFIALAVSIQLLAQPAAGSFAKLPKPETSKPATISPPTASTTNQQ